MLSAPTVIEYDGEAALFEWIDTPFLLPEMETLTPELATSLAETVYEIDKLTDSVDLKAEISAPWDNPTANFERWSKQPLEHELITQTELTELEKMVKNGVHSWSPRFQHGDMATWHIFDGEHGSSLHMPYTDFCRLYTILFMRLVNPASLC